MANDSKNSDNHQTEDPLDPEGDSRRQFLFQIGLAGAGLSIGLTATGGSPTIKQEIAAEIVQIRTTLKINGKKESLLLNSRSTLLDILRENLHLTGTKKGCNMGQCGSCTVLVNGQRINSCLRFGWMCNDMEITTIEGLSKGDTMHPMQESFLKHDAFQCGYCTPGQICSAVALLQEGYAKTDKDIQEQMSGNICRCGAYQNILAAIREVQTSHIKK